MAEIQYIPLTRERKIEMLRSLSSCVTHPDIYLLDISSWNKIVNEIDVQFTIETLDKDRSDYMMLAASRMLDMVLAEGYKTRRDKFIGSHWLVSNLTPITDAGIDSYMRIFDVDSEIAGKLKSLNDRQDSVEWIQIK